MQLFFHSMRLLNLAPHCSIPPMDGADRRAWHLHESMESAHFAAFGNATRDPRPAPPPPP
jgi:hypothetical protein